MANTNLSTRKPDVLDIWENLCNLRYRAYTQGDLQDFIKYNEQLKAIRKNNGWTDAEIQEEFAVYDVKLNEPFAFPSDNPKIKYDVLDEHGKPMGLSLSIAQVSELNNRHARNRSERKP